MSREKFFTIRRNLKFLVYDNVEPETKTTDRLWKVRPLLEALRQQCLKLKQKRFLSIYEQMIQFAGGCNMKQYVPNKSNPLGLKNFMLAGSSGLVYDFTIYQRKTTLPPDLQSKGLGTAAVLHFSKEVKEGSYLYFDRYFTNIRLLEGFTAVKVNVTGTLQYSGTSVFSIHTSKVRINAVLNI